MLFGETFVDALLDPEQSPPLGVVDPQGREAPKRFNVYRNNVVVSLIKAMETGFPATRRLIGQDGFVQLAAIFVRVSPPTSPLMMYYGAEFPEFLTQTSAIEDMPFLPDLAALEVALRHSYHAEDSTPVANEQFASITPEQLMEARFEFSPALQLLRSQWPIVDVWKAESVTLPVAHMSGYALVLRAEFDPTVHHLSLHEGEVLQCLIDGGTLNHALNDADGLDLTNLLSILLQNAAIIGIKI